MLLLWLSILIMIPFDLCRMDILHKTTPTDEHRQSTVQCIFDMATVYLGVNDKCKDAAALLMAKWVWWGGREDGERRLGRGENTVERSRGWRGKKDCVLMVIGGQRREQ